MDKHKVIIRRQEYEAYITKGYGLSASSVEDLLGPSERLLQGEDMLVVEIDAAKHQRLNQGERAFILWGSYDSYEIAEVQVQEKDLEEATVARTDRDTMPWVVSTSDLYESRRECAAGNAQYLRDRVKAFRDAADKVEEFMKRIECPPV